MSLRDQQAFPAAYTVGPNDDLYLPMPGMTYRQWLAGSALPGVQARARAFSSDDKDEPRWREEIAREAVRIADALIAELERP